MSILRRSGFLLPLLLVPWALSSAAAAEGVEFFLSGQIPVVISSPGAGTSQYRTSLQMYNPWPGPITARLAFHPQGTIAKDSDPALEFTLAAGETRSIPDVLSAMGLSGPRLGTLDVYRAPSGIGPFVSARIFNDRGTDGTQGFSIGAISRQQYILPGDFGILFAPPDTTRFRMNVGVRAPQDATRVRITRRRAAGDVVQTIDRTYPAGYFAQTTAAAFLDGSEVQAGDSIMIEILSGTLVAYAVTADNTTQDPSMQVAEVVPTVVTTGR